MRSHGRLAIIAGILLFIFASLCPTHSYCATAPAMPVEITGVRLSWVGAQSNVNPREKGEKTFSKGSKPPTSSDFGTTDRLREVVTTGNWGKLDVEFSTYRTWEDEIEFVFFLLIKDKDGFKMLKGSTTALYVAQGKGHCVVMYAYPNAIARYGADVRGVGVQAVIGGKAVSWASDPKANKPWWEEYSPITGAIIDWYYTPMGRTGVDGYELIKITK